MKANVKKGFKVIGKVVGAVSAVFAGIFIILKWRKNKISLDS